MSTTLRIPRVRFNFGDAIVVHPEEAGCPPFPGTIVGIVYHPGRDTEPSFWVMEEDGSVSDGWTERFFSMSRAASTEPLPIGQLLSDCGIEHRVTLANALIQQIANCGRCFFKSNGGRLGNEPLVARMSFELGTLWWNDEYSLVRTNLSHPGWTDKAPTTISHGSGLRSFIGKLRDYVITGFPFPLTVESIKHWEYGDDAAKVVEAAKKLGVALP